MIYFNMILFTLYIGMILGIYWVCVRALDQKLQRLLERRMHARMKKISSRYYPHDGTCTCDECMWEQDPGLR